MKTIIINSIISVIIIICPVILSNYLLAKTEGNIEGKTRWGKLENIKKTKIYWKQRGIVISYSLENYFWKRLWSCRKQNT